MREKNWGTPPTPLKKPILGGKKPKWAVSPRVRAECVRCPWLLAQTKVATIFDIFGPSGAVQTVSKQP